MKVIISTGGSQDFLELIADSYAECVNLVSLGNGILLKEHPEKGYVTTQNEKVVLRINLSQKLPAMLDAITRIDTDLTA